MDGQVENPDAFAVRGKLLMQTRVTETGRREIVFEWVPPNAQFAVVTREVMDELLRHVKVEGVTVLPPLP